MMYTFFPKERKDRKERELLFFCARAYAYARENPGAKNKTTRTKNIFDCYVNFKRHVMQRKTIKEISNLWKEDRKRYVKLSTISAYSLIIENHIIPDMGNMDRLSCDYIQKFALEKTAKGLSRKTVRDILAVLRMIVKFGERKGMLHHVEWSVKLPEGKEPQHPAIFSRAEQRTIMRHVLDNLSPKNLGIYICLSTGMRIGEICGLMWDDIDVETGIITVRRSVERVYVVDNGRRYTRLVTDTPKTRNSIRDIPMTAELARIICPLKMRSCPSTYILTGNRRPTEPRIYRRYYMNLMKNLGVHTVKFHGLRHSFATRCIESRCDYKTVSALLGHSKISTTLDLYVHPGYDQKKRCVEQMLRSLR